MTLRTLFTFTALALALAATAKQPKQKAATTDDPRTRVVLTTTMGDITIALYDETPLHKENFLKLAETHYLDSLLFHRVIRNFMIQTGDPDSRCAEIDTPLGQGGPGYTLPAEIRFPQLFHKRGAVAAARTGDEVNPERRSSGSQFYIVWGMDFTSAELDKVTALTEERSRGRVKFPAEVKKEYLRHGGTPHLDGSYTVFGEVVDGLKVVDKIQNVRINDFDRPWDEVRILCTKIIQPAQKKK